MKRNLFVLFFILFVKLSYAQQELLSFDEHNKYIFYQVNNTPNLSVDSLHERGLAFLKTFYPHIRLKSQGNINTISGDGKFITYGDATLLKHERGEINYVLNLELKDQKYRFWLTDFSFVPYERDRYGNFVPKLGIEIPLEDAASKLDKKDLVTYLDETGAFCKQFGERLKVYILNAPIKEESRKKVVTEKW